MEVLSETLTFIIGLLGLLIVIRVLWDKRVTSYNKVLLVFIYVIMLKIL